MVLIDLVIFSRMALAGFLGGFKGMQLGQGGTDDKEKEDEEKQEKTQRFHGGASLRELAEIFRPTIIYYLIYQ